MNVKVLGYLRCAQAVTPLMVASGIGWVEGVTYEWSPQQTLETVKMLLDLGADLATPVH